MEESFKRIDKYIRTCRTYYNLNRWIDIRIDALASLFSASLAFYLVYLQDAKASNTGFSLNMSIGFSSMILWWVRLLNQFEVQGTLACFIRVEQSLTVFFQATGTTLAFRKCPFIDIPFVVWNVSRVILKSNRRRNQQRTVYLLRIGQRVESYALKGSLRGTHLMVPRCSMTCLSRLTLENALVLLGALAPERFILSSCHDFGHLKPSLRAR